jgi:hypothetical protein
MRRNVNAMDKQFRATGHHDASNFREEHTVVNTQRKTSQDQNREDTLPSLQDQIAEAIQPLIGDLHEQITQTLRESLNAADDSSEDEDEGGEQDQQQQDAQQGEEDEDEEQEAQQDEEDEDEEQEAQQDEEDEDEEQEAQQAKAPDGESGDEEAGEAEDQQDMSPMAVVMKQTSQALQATFVELGKAVQQLLKTVQELLQSVASLVKLLVTGLKDGLGDAERESLSNAMTETSEALRATFVALGKTVRHLLKTVQQLLQAVASLVKLLVTALTQGLLSLGSVQSLIQSLVSNVVSSITQMGKDKVTGVVGDTVSSLTGGGKEGGEKTGRLLSRGKDKLLSLGGNNGEEEQAEGQAA